MTDGEPVKGSDGLSTNNFESDEENRRGNETYEQDVGRYQESQQETSTTRESADVGTRTSTTTAAQATVIHLPTAEASARARRSQTRAMASPWLASQLRISPRPIFCRPILPRRILSSSREPADVAILTQTTAVAPRIRIPNATSSTRVTPLNPNAAPFVPASHSSPGSAATLTPSQRFPAPSVPASHSCPASAPSQSTSAPNTAGLVSSNVTPSASGAAGPSTAIAQPASSISSGSSNTAGRNAPPGNTNSEPDTTQE